MPGVDYRTYRVLVVDDEESNLVLMRYALEPLFDVETTSDPKHAAELLASRKFAVLLSDQRMPGMSGVDLCAHARAVSPDTMRIIVTGYADVHATIDAVNRGAVMRYLEKPVRDAHLQEVVRSAIDIVHAKNAINALEKQMVRGGSDEAFRALEARLARDLEAPTRSLAEALEHLRDLTTALHDIRQRRAQRIPDRLDSDIPVLEDMTQTHESMETTLRMFRTLTERLQRNRQSSAKHADVRRIVGAVETSSGRANTQRSEPLEVCFDPQALAQALSTFFRRALAVSQADASISIETDDAGHVTVVITDAGPRLTREELASLFDVRSVPLPGDDGTKMALAAETLRAEGAHVEAKQDGRSCVIRTYLGPSR